MGLFNFIAHPVSSISLRLIEELINNFDSSLIRTAISLFGISEKDVLILQSVNRMVNHIAISVDHNNSFLEIRLKLAGEQEELRLCANYTKESNEGQTRFSFQTLETSKEWLTILVNDILVGEVLSKDDMQFGTDKLLGKILNKIL